MPSDDPNNDLSNELGRMIGVQSEPSNGRFQVVDDRDELRELREENLRLTQELELIKAVESLGLSCRISAKGGISVYGLQKMPVTLYADQWLKLSKIMGFILWFIERNADKLREKTTDAPASATSPAQPADSSGH